MSSWNISVDSRGRSGVENMTLDNALLDQALESGGAFLRLYRWDPPTLSIGRNQQNVFKHVPVVRRPTGGQAVWHEHEVTYAVAAPVALYGSLRNAYCQIHEHIAAALRSLGVYSVLAERQGVSPSRRLASCFAVPVGGEILVNGRKLVGSAQVRRQNAFLQHGSILLAGSQPGDGREITMVAALGRPVTFDEVARAIIAHWPSLPSYRPTVLPPVIASPAAR